MAEHGSPTFGGLLRRYREAARLTQEDLADRTGLSVTAISALERDIRRAPFRRTVDRLAEALHLTSAQRQELEQTIVRYRHREKPPRPQSEHDRTFFGRERELSWLTSHMQRVPLLFVVGEPGIGKSRLLSELGGWARQRGWCVLSGSCERDSEQESYTPVIEALGQHLRQQSIEIRQRSLQAYALLAPLMPDLVAQTEPIVGASAKHDQRLLFATIERYLANIANSPHTLLLLDDLQWAGPDALHLIAYLTRKRLSLCIVGTYRSTEVQPGHPLARLIADLASEGLAQEIPIGSLNASEASELTSALLHSLPIEPDRLIALIDRVVKRTAGVLFYLVSYINWLQSLAEEDTRAATEEIELLTTGIEQIEQAMPWDIKKNIRERVAALPAAARDVLDLIAIAGKGTSGDLIVASGIRSEDEVIDGLEAACQARLLAAAEQDQTDTYRFTHELIREIIETDLSGRRRMMLHRRVAEAIEQIGPIIGESSGLLAAKLAFHYARAGKPEKAINFLQQAGEHARAIWAHEDAARHYRELAETLDRLGRIQEAAEAREHLGKAQAHLGRFGEAIATLDLAEQAYRKGGARDAQMQVVMAIGHLHATRGTPEDGWDRLWPYVTSRRTEQPGVEALNAGLFGTLAHLAFMSGRYQEALDAAKLAVNYAQIVQDIGMIARVRLQLGIALLSIGDTAEALDTFQQAAIEAEAAKDPATAGEIWLQACVAYQTRGEFGPSQQALTQAIAAASQADDYLGIGHSTFLQALLFFYLGEWNKAGEIARRSEALFRQFDLAMISAYAPMGLGWLCLMEGKDIEALAYLEEAQNIAVQSKGDQVLRLIAELRAEHALLAGRSEEALAP